MMFIVVNSLNPDPMYKQVTDQIKDAIAGNALKAGAKLPSIREMAKDLQLSAITIKRAYSDLENEGYIFTRSGLGSFVAEIDRGKLKQEKTEEIRQTLSRLVIAAGKFGITRAEIIRMVEKIKEP